MTKLELNEKLDKLYGLESSILTDHDIYGNDFEVLLIDDSARMFDLMFEYQVLTTFYPSGVTAYQYQDEYGFLVGDIDADFKDHESIQAAGRYAIAMVLTELAESK